MTEYTKTVDLELCIGNPNHHGAGNGCPAPLVLQTTFPRRNDSPCAAAGIPRTQPLTTAFLFIKIPSQSKHTA